VRPTAPPAQSLDAGTVGDGVPAGVSGEGPAEITFVREGATAIVVSLECSACEGPTVLTAPGRMSPLDEEEGPIEGSYLVDVFEDTDPEQSLWLTTEGEWTVELASWNDLPLVSGGVEGTGSTVIFFGDDAASSLVTWKPEDGEDVFQARFFGVDREDAFMFGDSVEFSDEIEFQRPGVIAITTDGSWSIEPID
jgi:hypothetical protein